jgi:L-ascorbate metabolism protein UlaG (beta-lactamase superfamily)
MSALHVGLTWLGHATFLLKTPEQKAILIDPWLRGNPKCPSSFHDVASDAILVTHGHSDHVGDAVSAASRCSGKLVAIYDLTVWLKSRGVAEEKLVGMNKGGTVELENVKLSVTMTDARHSSSWSNGDGTNVYLGEAAGYVLGFSNGFTLYVAGDTCLFGDMEWVGKLYRPHAAILPIGDLYTMDPRAAAHACKLLGVQAVVPSHYGTFPVLTGTPEQLKKHLADLDLHPRVVELQPGCSETF